MFDNDLIWEQFLLERKDAEKIQQAENIYADYINRISKPIRDYVNILDSPENVEKYATYSIDINVDFNELIKRKLDINFENDKFSKTGNKIGGSYVPDKYSINIYYTELKDLVIDLKDLIREYNYKKIGEIDESFSDEMRILFPHFLHKMEERKSIIIHELIHYFDNQHFNIGDKVQKLHSMSDTADEYFNKYINSFWEVNAYTLESIFKHGNVDTIDKFLRLVRTKDIDWLDNLNEKNKKKVLKRVYDYFQNKNNRND